MKGSTGGLPSGWRMAVNPMEWLSWLYRKFFTNHTILSYFLVGSLTLLVALIVWTRAIDKYREEHPPSPVPAAEPQNKTYGPQSPIMPNNSGTVNITNEPPEGGSPPVKQKRKKDGKEIIPDKSP